MSTPKTLLELSYPVAADYVGRALGGGRGKHSCEWRRLLPAFTTATHLHLHKLLQFALELMPQIAKRRLVHAEEESTDYHLSCVEKDGRSIPDFSFLTPAPCEHCNKEWIKTAKSVNEYSRTAVAYHLKFDSMRVLKKYGFLPYEQLRVIDVFLGLYRRGEDGESHAKLCSALDTVLDEFEFDVNTQSRLRANLMHYMPGNNYFNGQFLEYLISRGAKVNSQNYQGNTPLHEFATHARMIPPPGDPNREAAPMRDRAIDKCHVLLRHKADMSIENRNYETPLDLAFSWSLSRILPREFHVLEMFFAHGSPFRQMKVAGSLAMMVENYEYGPVMQKLYNLLFAVGFDFGSLNRLGERYHVRDGECGCAKCKGLAPYRCNVRSLMALGRCAVRGELQKRHPGFSIEPDVQQLEIPVMLKAYLMMDPVV